MCFSENGTRDYALKHKRYSVIQTSASPSVKIRYNFPVSVRKINLLTKFHLHIFFNEIYTKKQENEDSDLCFCPA